MDEEKVVETTPVEEETTPVETVETVEETAPIENVDESTDLKALETLIREVLTEIKALSTLIASDTTVQVEDVEDGSNDTNVYELESQLEDLDF